MNDSPANADRTLTILLTVIGALVVIALIVVFTRPGERALDPSTPQGVVQAYASAVIDGDRQAALDYVSRQRSDECQRLDGARNESVRIALVSVTERSSTAVVRVSIELNFDSGPFASSGYTTEDVFELAKVDGDWLITRAPWDLAVCEELVK